MKTEKEMSVNMTREMFNIKRIKEGQCTWCENKADAQISLNEKEYAKICFIHLDTLNKELRKGLTFDLDKMRKREENLKNELSLEKLNRRMEYGFALFTIWLVLLSLGWI